MDRYTVTTMLSGIHNTHKLSFKKSYDKVDLLCVLFRQAIKTKCKP